MTEQREWIEKQGWRLVLVHMNHDQELPPLIQGIDYGYIDHISDPHCELYRSFDLAKGTLRQLLGLPVWWRGIQAMLKGNRGGKLRGDGLQMPGMFLVSKERIVHAHRAAHVADHGDVRSFAAKIAS